MSFMKINLASNALREEHVPTDTASKIFCIHFTFASFDSYANVSPDDTSKEIL